MIIKWPAVFSMIMFKIHVYVTGGVSDSAMTLYDLRPRSPRLRQQDDNAMEVDQSPVQTLTNEKRSLSSFSLASR